MWDRKKRDKTHFEFTALLRYLFTLLAALLGSRDVKRAGGETGCGGQQKGPERWRETAWSNTPPSKPGQQEESNKGLFEQKLYP